MPKTGSQTVEASLHQCSLPHRIVRCHFLSAARRAELRETLRTQDCSEAWKQQARQQLRQVDRLSCAISLRNLLRSCKIPIPRLEIVSAVREPIGLSLSSVFQNYLYFVPSPDLLTLKLCSEVLQRPRMCKSLEQWFETELIPITRLNIYQKSFPREQGYAIYENSRARILLYKFEALNQLQPMMRAFLGCSLPAVLNRNLGSTKPYWEQYDYAKRHLGLPSAFVEARYQTRLARHFYTPQELAVLARQWTSGAVQPAPSPSNRPAEEPTHLVTHCNCGTMHP